MTEADERPAMLRVAFVGAFSASIADRVRAHLAVPCDIVLTDEAEVTSRIPEVDVVVTLVFTAGMGAVWTLNQGDGSVSRIDPRTNRVSAVIEVGVPGEGGDIAAGEGAVWVTAIGKPLSRIDATSNRVTRQFVGKGGDALRVGLGSLWLANHEFHEVWRVDPKGI